MALLWLSRAVVGLIHEDQRQLYGGNSGVLNQREIELALGRARNRLEYGQSDLFDCAACYIFGLAKNHGYQDANKRTAFACGLTFLRLNGVRIVAKPENAIKLMLDVITNVRGEAVIAEWLRARAALYSDGNAESV